MKKLNLFLGALVTLLFISCEGPQGPPGSNGFDGFDGEDGEDGLNGINAELSKVFDIGGNFTAAGDYSIFVDFTKEIPDVEVFETDIVLVYLLWDQTEDGNGDPVDIWRLMPQTRIIDQGLLQYNYDYTFFNVNIFLESDFDLATLPPGDTDNQIFRIAIIPAEFATGKFDISNINAVMRQLGISDADVQRIHLK